MGASTSEGVSSGLHHDFADNLYIVLKGQKAFTIFPPSDADKLYVRRSLNNSDNNPKLFF